MNVKKRRKLKKGETVDAMQPSPFELEVCKYMYRNLTTKEGRLAGCHVCYFRANDAVDFLLNSKLTSPNEKEHESKSIFFTSPDVAVRFMEKLVEKRLIGRALKVKRKAIAKRADEDKRSKVRKDKDPKEFAKSTRPSSSNEGSLPTEISTLANPTPKDTYNSSSNDGFMSFFSSCRVAKRKKPVRLEYAPDQTFILDSKSDEIGVDDVYIWIYEAPPSLATWLQGFALIAFIIACCAYPMWPSQARQGGYYLTILGLSLIGFFLLLAFVRLIFYVFILIFSFGRFRIWIFPNLFADCGFVESFRPLYSFEQVTPSSVPNSNNGASGITN